MPIEVWVGPGSLVPSVESQNLLILANVEGVYLSLFKVITPCNTESV